MPDDWARFEAELLAAADTIVPPEPAPRDFARQAEAFRDEVRRRRLLVPEHDVVMVGHGTACWTPRHEADAPIEPTPAPPACEVCGGSIEPGEVWYCPKCKSSGYDDRLAVQKGLAPVPPPEPAPTKHVATPAPPKKHGITLGSPTPPGAPLSRKTRRELRAEKFGHGNPSSKSTGSTEESPP